MSSSDDAASSSSASASTSTAPSSNSDSNPSTAPMAHPATAATTTDRSQLLAQAIRFLTSARFTGDATDEIKRQFLRSKGLSEAEIHTVFRDATSPATTSSSSATATASTPAETEDDAFQRAASEFDDPINAASLVPPPRTYPKSPLALYYEAPPQNVPSHSHLPTNGHAASSATRYQVLLQFFKTLSFFMVLGGGATALSVAIWRTYVLPRITAMFDARSIVLSHHSVLFDKLRASVLGMATYLPASATESVKRQQQQQRKGVLKKVHFGDEVNGGQLDDSASAAGGGGTKGEKQSSEKVDPAPTADTETDGKVGGQDSKEGGSPSDVAAAAASAAEGEEAAVEPAPPKLEPIDLTEPLRQSISRLASVLRADMSSSSVGQPVGGGTPSDTGASTSIATSDSTPVQPQPRAATVSDATSDSDSEWSDSDADSQSDDGLEFDPYGSCTKKKHTQASSTSSPTSAGSSSSKKSASLRTSLTSLSAEINSRQFMASNASFAASSVGMRYGATTPSATTAGSTGSQETRSGEIGQVKAEIRSLKGLLLSRRNFPSYAARVPMQQTAAERAGGTVV